MGDATRLDNKEDVNASYRQAIGSLMYLPNVTTRPDITYAAKQGQSVPRETIEGTLERHQTDSKVPQGHDYELYFDSGSDDKILTYSDSNYAGNTETRRSTTGYVVKLESSTITWKSQR